MKKRRRRKQSALAKLKAMGVLDGLPESEETKKLSAALDSLIATLDGFEQRLQKVEKKKR